MWRVSSTVARFLTTCDTVYLPSAGSISDIQLFRHTRHWSCLIPNVGFLLGVHYSILDNGEIQGEL